MITQKISQVKNLDISLKGIRMIEIIGTEGDELCISGTEVKIDDKGGRSTDISFKGESDEIMIKIPTAMYNDIELCCTSAKILIKDIKTGDLEIDSNDPLDITAHNVTGNIKITQIKASSVLKVDKSASFRTVCKGKNTLIETAGFKNNEIASEYIELNGKDSTLTIESV